MPREQVDICGNNNIVLRLKRTLWRAPFPSITMADIQKYHEEVRKDMIGSRDSANMQIQNIDGNAEPFLCFI